MNPVTVKLKSFRRPYSFGFVMLINVAENILLSLLDLGDCICTVQNKGSVANIGRPRIL